MKPLLTLSVLLLGHALHAQTFFHVAGTPNRLERGQTVHRMPGGELFIGGTLGDSAMVQRIDTLGQVLWTRTFKPSPGYPCVTMHLSDTPDGYLIGCGNGLTGGPGALDNGFHFKLDLNGNVHWIRRWSDTRPVYSKRIVALSSTEYLLFADVYDMSGPNYADIFTTRIDAATGDLTWNSDLVDQFAAVPYIDDIAGSVELNGSHYTTSRIFTNGASVSTCRVYLSKFDGQGNYQWTKYLFYSNTANKRMYGSDIIAQGDSLTLLFFGNVNGSSANYSVGVARTDTMGNVAWGRMYDVPGNNSEYGSSIVNTAYGYALTGYTIGTGTKDLFMLGISPQGDLLWSKTHGGSTLDEGLTYPYAPNMVADSSELLVVGRRLASGNEDLLLIRTDANGDLDCDPAIPITVNVSTLPTAHFATTSSTTPLSIALVSEPAWSTASMADACALAASLGPDTTLCDTLWLDAGNPGATYLWSDGSTAQTLLANGPGTYTVQVTLDCCTTADTIQVLPGDLPVAAFTWVQDPPGSTNGVFTNTSLNDESALWIFGSTTATGDSLTFGFQGYGHYIVCLIVTNACGSDTICEEVDVFPATGLGGLDPGVQELTTRISGDRLFVAFPGAGVWDLEMIDARGAVVRQVRCSGPTADVPLPDVRNGLYVLRAQREGVFAVGRVVAAR
jgi:hypothetical protein